MNHRTLGRTGIEVSELSFGTLILVPTLYFIGADLGRALGFGGKKLPEAQGTR